MINKPIILVVEDERPLAEAIKKKLEKCDFEVVTARTVEQAMSYFDEQVKINGIWLDHYLLGKENGLDLVTKIKSEESEWKTIPIFVVSNTASPDKVQAYLKLGVDKYYTKADFKLEEIINDIRATLNLKEKKCD